MAITITISYHRDEAGDQAKSMPQWPHWYVFREWGNAREFDFFERLIAKHGYPDKWGKRNDS
jgi:hypothetical protein